MPDYPVLKKKLVRRRHLRKFADPETPRKGVGIKGMNPARGSGRRPDGFVRGSLLVKIVNNPVCGRRSVARIPEEKAGLCGQKDR